MNGPNANAATNQMSQHGPAPLISDCKSEGRYVEWNCSGEIKMLHNLPGPSR
jgi:hypothetical protein